MTRRLLSLVGAVAILAAAIEGGSFLILRWRDAHNASAIPPLPPALRNAPWAAEYWREWRAAVRLPERMRSRGEGVMHLAPFHGRLINIEEDGSRRTTNIDCREGALRIDLFGGSMLWGHGAVDAETIPSFLAAHFHQDGRPACVHNHGEWGSTTQRASIELVQLLARGERPDIVVFYSGSYDIKETLLGNEMDHWLMDREPVSRCSTLALLRRLRKTPPEVMRLTPAEVARARATTIRRFQQTHDLVETLAKRYRFTPFFIWHPYVLVARKPLTPEERVPVEGFERNLPGMAAAIRATYDAMRGSQITDSYDLSGVFDGEHETLYLDAGHLLPAGNRIVSDQIYSIIRNRMEASKPVE